MIDRKSISLRRGAGLVLGGIEVCFLTSIFPPVVSQVLAVFARLVSFKAFLRSDMIFDSWMNIGFSTTQLESMCVIG